MIGMVLVTHGNLATEFLVAMQHVVGEPFYLIQSPLLEQMRDS